MKAMLLAFAAAAAVATPAAAQDSDLPDPNQRRDSITIGAGAAWIPDYEGSDDYKITPAAAVRGQVGGVSFFSRATWLYVDLIPRGSGSLEFDAGPIVGVRLNRTGKIKDDVVDLLPERKAAIEAGGFVGMTLHGLTNPYDSLSLRVDMVKDVGSEHGSVVFTPTLDFGTPLSKTFYIGLSASVEAVGDGYAEHYYSVTAADSVASGLPFYEADGGFKNWRVGLLANQSITGDLLHGWSLVGTASYGQLYNDFRRSPIVADRGSKGQGLVALGLAYTF